MTKKQGEIDIRQFFFFPLNSIEEEIKKNNTFVDVGEFIVIKS